MGGRSGAGVGVGEVGGRVGEMGGRVNEVGRWSG